MKKAFTLILSLFTFSINISYAQIEMLDNIIINVKPTSFYNIIESNNIIVEFDMEHGIQFSSNGVTHVIDTNNNQVADALVSNLNNNIILVKSGWNNNVVCFSPESNSIIWTVTIGPGGVNICQNNKGDLITIADRDNGNVYLIDIVNKTVNRLDSYKRFAFYSGIFDNGYKFSIGTSNFNDPSAHELRIYDQKNKQIASTKAVLNPYNPDLSGIFYDPKYNTIFIDGIGNTIEGYKILDNEIVHFSINNARKFIGIITIGTSSLYITKFENMLSFYNTDIELINKRQITLSSITMGIANIFYKNNTLLVYEYRMPK